MKKSIGCLLGLLVVAGIVGVIAVGQYNGLVASEQEVEQAWSNVQNVYQRRADLVPNLVATVQGSANFEQSTLTAVIEARSRVGQISSQATQEILNDPQKFAQFQQAQDGLSSALSRLMVVVERYPELKSDQNFRDLQAQLEGTENRITVARNRYIQAVQDFNVTVRRFPTNLTAMLFGYKVKPNFTVENEAAIARPPTVDFSTPAPAPQAAPEPAPAPAGN